VSRKAICSSEKFMGPLENFFGRNPKRGLPLNG
jgi:hypothetical protein